MQNAENEYMRRWLLSQLGLTLQIKASVSLHSNYWF